MSSFFLVFNFTFLSNEKIQQAAFRDYSLAAGMQHAERLSYLLVKLSIRERKPKITP